MSTLPADISQVALSRKAREMAASKRVAGKPVVKKLQPPKRRAPMRRIDKVNTADQGDGDSADSDGAARPVRLLFKPEVMKLVGHTFPTIWRWMRDGKFPLSVNVGAKTAWYENEINAWIANQPRSQFKFGDAK